NRRRIGSCRILRRSRRRCASSRRTNEHRLLRSTLATLADRGPCPWGRYKARPGKPRPRKGGGPMAFELKMPKLGESVTEGTIGKWLKKPGEKVNKYDLLVEVQTDKANTEIPSPVSGTLSEIKVEEGQTVPIGTLLAVFDTADEAAAASPAGGAPPARSSAQVAEAPAPSAPRSSAPAPSAPRSSAPAQTGVTVGAPSRAPTTVPAAPSGDGNGQSRTDLSDVRATPAVRKLASEHGIDISQIEGTGLGGRVSKKDVEDFIAQQSARPQTEAPRPQAGQVIPAQPQAQPARAAPVPSLSGDTLVPLT